MKLKVFPRCFHVLLSSKLSSKYLVNMHYIAVSDDTFILLLNASDISSFFLIAGPICFGNFYGSER